MDWTWKFLFLFGMYLLFLQIANSHHLSGSNIRGVNSRMSSRRLNGNRLLRVQSSSTSVSGQLATNTRSNQRTAQRSSTSSLQQEVLSLRRRLALAEEQRIRAASSRQRLSQTRQSSARQISLSRSVRPNARGVNLNPRRLPSRIQHTNTNRRSFQSNPSSFRRNQAPQIVIELERDNQHPMDKFQEMSSNLRHSTSNNLNSIQNEEKQLLEMLSKLLATTPAPLHNPNINDINALLQQLQNDPGVANQLQQVLAGAPGGVKQIQPEPRTQPPPPPQPPTPQTLWQQVQSLSDPRKARELRLRDPLHFAFLTSILEGDIPDPPDIPDPIQPQTPRPPVQAKPVAGNVKLTTNVQKAETISVPIQKEQIVSASSPISGKGTGKNVIDSKRNTKTETVVNQASLKPGNAQKLSETPVFKPVNTQSNAQIQQPKIIVIRDSTAGTNPFVVQTDQFGQSSIVIDTGNPHLQKLIQAQQKPTVKPVVSAAENIADATATAVKTQTVETKVTAKDSGALTVKKEINTKIVSQNGTQPVVVKTAVEVTTVLPVATDPTTLPLEPTEAP